MECNVCLKKLNKVGLCHVGLKMETDIFIQFLPFRITHTVHIACDYFSLKSYLSCFPQNDLFHFGKSTCGKIAV